MEGRSRRALRTGTEPLSRPAAPDPAGSPAPSLSRLRQRLREQPHRGDTEWLTHPVLALSPLLQMQTSKAGFKLPTPAARASGLRSQRPQDTGKPSGGTQREAPHVLPVRRAAVTGVPRSPPEPRGAGTHTGLSRALACHGTGTCASPCSPVPPTRPWASLTA